MDNESVGEPVELEGEPITEERLAALKKSTYSKTVEGAEIFYPTCYRKGEFEWVKRLGIDLRNLLHVEQEFEHFAPLELDKTPKIRSKLGNYKKRGGITFLTVESEVMTGGDVRAVSRSTFLIKNSKAE